MNDNISSNFSQLIINLDSIIIHVLTDSVVCESL